MNASFTLEISQPRVEKYDRFASVDLDAINPANGLRGALVFANRDGRGRSLQPARIRPEGSFGMAWNPRGDSKSVVRLSYGLSFSTIPIIAAPPRLRVSASSLCYSKACARPIRRTRRINKLHINTPLRIIALEAERNGIWRGRQASGVHAMGELPEVEGEVRPGWRSLGQRYSAPSSSRGAS